MRVCENFSPLSVHGKAILLPSPNLLLMILVMLKVQTKWKVSKISSHFTSNTVFRSPFFQGEFKGWLSQLGFGLLVSAWVMASELWD